MSGNVAGTKQKFFKPITGQAEKDVLFKSMLLSQCLLQLKQEGDQGVKDESDLTIVQVADWYESTVVTNFIKGPKLQPSGVTIVFDLVKSMYFCTGDLKESAFGKYKIVFNKIFELQRRDAYRVTIPPNSIKARFYVSQIPDRDESVSYRIEDLSAGGMGLILDKTEAADFTVGMRLDGTLKVGEHPEIAVTALVKHVRKIMVDKVITFHVGCAFTEMAAALNQKISFLVNDCHRQTFARLTK